MNMLLLAGVLAGLFWLQKGKNNTVAGAQQTIGLLFFELLFLSFRALFVALFTFPDERKMLLKVGLPATPALQWSPNQSHLLSAS